MKTKYPPGSIGYSMEIGEQAGRDAWLAGIPIEECPYTTYEDTIERAGWLLGWALLDHKAKTDDQ